MTDHDAYCETLVREEDKDRFLATLFAPASCRPALFALYAFDLEIARVAHLVKEPMVGEIRLQWWHDVVTGQAHAGGSPVATALIEAMRAFSLPEDRLVEALDARREALHPDAGVTPRDIEDRARRAGAPIFELAARILNDGAEPEIGSLSAEAGTAFVLLRQFPEDPGLREIASMRLKGARDALRCISERLWPAFLPLAVLNVLLMRQGRELPRWRRQWILWRAARDLPRALS
jgi:phytoene synthase